MAGIRTLDRLQTKFYAGVSAARQYAHNTRVPLLDADSPQFRLTCWRAPAQEARTATLLTQPGQGSAGRAPADWPEVVIIGMNQESWREASDARFKLAVAYAAGPALTALMVGDVIEDKEAGVGIGQFNDDLSLGGVALRLGAGPLHAAVGIRNTANDHFYNVPGLAMVMSDPIPQQELAHRWPGVVLL